MSGEPPSEARVEIGGDGTIPLGSFLKLAGAASTGGEAKVTIQEGLVRVNGEVEMRRGRKLKAGDRVEVEGHGVYVVAAPGG
jgi:ribosome-associated protein